MGVAGSPGPVRSPKPESMPRPVQSPTPGQMLTGKQKSAVSRSCSLAVPVQMKSLVVEAGKREHCLS